MTGIAGLQGARDQQGFAESGNLKDFGISVLISTAQLAGTAQPWLQRAAQKPSRNEMEKGETLLWKSGSLSQWQRE